MSAIIEARELSRWYGIVLGLNNVSFEIQPGLTGLVGSNGAGKSTLIQIVTGQLRPSSGTLTVFGERAWNNPRLLRRIGFCPEKESVHKDMKPMDWLRALGLLAGLSDKTLEKRSEAMLERVGLAREHWNKRIGQYSKGMRQRVKLAQAMLHDPDLLVLDEPMNGLDPMGRQEIGHILKDFVSEGKSVIISSHILPELETLCKNILILNWGRIIATGNQETIRKDQKSWAEQVSIRCDDPDKLTRHLFDAGVLLGFSFNPETSTLNIQIKDPVDFYRRWNDLLIESEVKVYSIQSESRSLKQIFEKVTA